MNKRLCENITQYDGQWWMKEQSKVRLAEMRQIQKNLLPVNVTYNFGKKSLRCFYFSYQKKVM